VGQSPASHKKMDPRYRDVKAAQIPEAVRDGARIKTFAARWMGGAGRCTRHRYRPEYRDVTLPPAGGLSPSRSRGPTMSLLT